MCAALISSIFDLDSRLADLKTTLPARKAQPKRAAPLTSFSSLIEGVRSITRACTPFGKQKPGRSLRAKRLPGGYLKRTSGWRLVPAAPLYIVYLPWGIAYPNCSPLLTLLDGVKQGLGSQGHDLNSNHHWHLGGRYQSFKIRLLIICIHKPSNLLSCTFKPHSSDRTAASCN